MQLTYKLLAIALLISSGLYAQESSDSNEAKKLNETEINFLFNYYEQDGNNAAVTGGRGTEELTNVAPAVIINIPIDTSRTLSTYFGFDNYSSASTDNIDNNVSSASSSDTRYYVNATYSKTNTNQATYSVKAGYSQEYDYTSISAGLGWAKEFNNQNTELNLSGLAYFDTWKLLYPAELRTGEKLVDTDKRQSFNFSATLAQVISKRLQASLSLEYVFQTGLLSTPFHRVYFNDAINNPISPKVEKLPDSRTKIPVGLRINYYLNDLIILRGYYRFYHDDFDIDAHTMNLEVPVKVAQFFTVYPFFRYHTQTASKYFAPYGVHERSEEYYSSDYDLSALNSTSLGLGLKYSPLYGLTRFKGPFSKKTGRITSFKSVDVRFADYTRTGNNPGGGGDLDAYSLSFEFTFVF
ncbi:DUF3570 domain-containing protein [Fulvivirga sediminis]|uniref:DUF3570 domain-containing protein n=1 Tax=Fulvivirga sediminis TaxID=2803949 RepID=A0A937FCH9_9BACT|nr:DUF3570 domain-containing protein [Fulvivirga sediminis]MBL3657903.1 DUF3570 domain-containing protein [Fulvivirga sediminis]